MRARLLLWRLSARAAKAQAQEECRVLLSARKSRADHDAKQRDALVVAVGAMVQASSI